MQETLCEQNSESGGNRYTNRFSVTMSWTLFRSPRLYYLLYCKFKVSFSFRKIREKKTTFYGCSSNCCQSKLFLRAFLKRDSRNLCNTEKNNESRGR